MLKVCLVGVGGISRVHIPAWQRIPEVELVGICDIRPEQMAKYNDAPMHQYTDFEEMMDAEQPDILDICLPTFLHAEYIRRGIARGVHVLCEKPISLHRDEVAGLYAAAKERGVKLMIAQVLRFWPEYVFVKKALDEGTYGKLLQGEMHRIGATPAWSWDNWMTDCARSGLAALDLHVHDLDFLVYTLGAPEKTDFRRDTLNGSDALRAVYHFANGADVTAFAAWYKGDHPFLSGFRFHFERAVIETVPGGLTVYPVEGESFTVKPGEATGEAAINLPATDAYYEEIRYFTDRVLDGGDILVKPEELETVLSILE